MHNEKNLDFFETELVTIDCYVDQSHRFHSPTTRRNTEYNSQARCLIIDSIARQKRERFF